MDIRLLGPFEVVDSNGQTVNVSGGRQRTLLALLAYEAPNSVSEDRIVDELWPGMDVSDPHAALQVVASRLRKAIEGDVVVHASGFYGLKVPHLTVDIDRFRRHVKEGQQLAALDRWPEAAERFRTALGQWRGSPFASFAGYGFAEEATRVLDEERLVAVEASLEAELALGNYALSLAELTRQTDAHPLRERLWRLLMLAQYRAGRQADALRSYQQASTILGEELGIAPSKELSDLEERILLHDPALLTPTRLWAPDVEAEPRTAVYTAGDLIAEEGTPGDVVYWIESGRVELFHPRPGGDERVAELGPNQRFGETEMLLGAGRITSARALAPTTLSVHGVSSLRQRLGLDRVGAAPDATLAASLRELIRRGQYLRAYDLGVERADAARFDPEVGYLSVLALARSGAAEEARRRFGELGLASLDLTQLAPELAEDISAMEARLDKDLALHAHQEGERMQWARRAALGYQSAFDRYQTAYLAVNAATMHLLAGDLHDGGLLAELALGQLEDHDGRELHDYWKAASEAEASIILGLTARAEDALTRAAQATPENHSARATTIRQLRLVCELTGANSDILDAIKNPTVVHYTGHRFPTSADGPSRTDEPSIGLQIRETLERLGVGYGVGSLAAGADILVAEALLERKADLQIVLPFDRNEFLDVSVAPFGLDWVQRFERCLKEASRVAVATRGGYQDDPVLFDLCARIAMGDAVALAAFLETEAHQIAIWDGQASAERAGTSVDVAQWAATRRGTQIIPMPRSQSEHKGRSTEGSQASGHEEKRKIRFIMQCELAEQDVLREDEMIASIEGTLGAMEAIVKRHQPHIVEVHQSGDGIRVIFENVLAATETALQVNGEGVDHNLGDRKSPKWRILLHASPLYERPDPWGEGRIFYGVDLIDVDRTVRRLPAGGVYATHPFHSLAVLSGSDRIESQYVGYLPGSIRDSAFPLYALRSGSPQQK